MDMTEEERLDEISARLAGHMRQLGLFASPDGEVERQQLWQARDGWLVGYTTTKVIGGPHDGKFVAMAYKPRGEGARSGDPSSWERVYWRGFAKRRSAKARAITLYDRHDSRQRG
jgi:hypothetical protein